MQEGETESKTRFNPGFYSAAAVLSAAVGAPVEFSDAYKRSHLPKPVVLATGASKVPIVPHVLALQIFMIGDLALAAIPGEFTTMAGRRLIHKLEESLGLQDIALVGYANDYSQYIVTYEEYQAQHYEGASTLFGPYTLDAYLDAFGKLAKTCLEEGAKLIKRQQVLSGLRRRPVRCIALL